MMSKSLFISRTLSPDSCLWNLSQDFGLEIIDKSLLRFQASKIETLPSSDWLFFYSKNGIKHFFGQVALEELSPSTKIGVMGKASAQFLKKHYAIEADFIGEGTPDQIGNKFQKVLTNTSVCFVQGSNSKKSIQNKIPSSQQSSLVSYINEVDSNVAISSTDIAVLTSPLNVQAYFRQLEWQPDTSYISIGPSTSAAFVEVTSHLPIECQQAREDSIMSQILGLLKK